VVVAHLPVAHHAMGSEEAMSAVAQMMNTAIGEPEADDTNTRSQN
jgi:hypothetical protein